VALAPQLSYEPLDDEGRISCGHALLQVACDPTTPAETRALAVSVVRLDAFAATVSPQRIPTIFDVPRARSR
jgi:hypothetical protein